MNINIYMPPLQTTRGCERIENYWYWAIKGWVKRRVESVYHSPPVKLVHALRHVNGFLDFTDDKDAGKHLFQLFFWDGLSWVPDGAVGSHYRLRSQVEGVVATFSTLWTEAEGTVWEYFLEMLINQLLMLHFKPLSLCTNNLLWNTFCGAYEVRRCTLILSLQKQNVWKVTHLHTSDVAVITRFTWTTH